MKRILIAAAAIIAATAAHAWPSKWATEVSRKRVHELPRHMLGEWCFSEADGKYSTYTRKRCRDSDGWINIRPRGYVGHETNCTLKFVILQLGPRREFYLTTFKCWGEGDEKAETVHLVLSSKAGTELDWEVSDAKFSDY